MDWRFTANRLEQKRAKLKESEEYSLRNKNETLKLRDFQDRLLKELN